MEQLQNNPVINDCEYIPQYVDLEKNLSIQSIEKPVRHTNNYSNLFQSILSEINNREIKKMKHKINALQNKIDNHVKESDKITFIYNIKIVILVIIITIILIKVFS